MRIASEDAQFGVPAGKLGLGYRFAGIKRLADVVGPAFTAEIFFTARQFNAQEALQMNLVNRVVPAAELEKYVREYASTIAANAPLTIAAVKRALIEYLKDPAKRDSKLCQKHGRRLLQERGLQGRPDCVHGKAQARVQRALKKPALAAGTSGLTRRRPMPQGDRIMRIAVRNAGRCRRAGAWLLLASVMGGATAAAAADSGKVAYPHGRYG